MALTDTDLLLANRGGVDYQTAATALKSYALDGSIIHSATKPTSPPYTLNAGTIWVDTSQSPATINVWDPTANAGAGGWEQATASGPKPANPAPSDVAATPAFVSGTGTQADPFVISPSTVAAPGGTATSAQTITINGKADDTIAFVDLTAGTNGARFTQAAGVIGAGGSWSGTLSYLDTPNSVAGATFTGDLQIGTTYFRWVVTQQVSVAPVIDTVVLADSPEAGRFTSGTFQTTVTLTTDGTPASTKGLKAWVAGTLKAQPISDEITAVNAAVLTLKTDKDLLNFRAGDAVKQNAVAPKSSAITASSTATYTPPANWSIYVGVNPPSPNPDVQQCAWPAGGTGAVSVGSSTVGIPTSPGSYAILDAGIATAGVKAGLDGGAPNWCASTNADVILMGSHTGLANSWVPLDSTYGKNDLPNAKGSDALIGYGYRYFLYTAHAPGRLSSPLQSSFDVPSKILGSSSNGFFGTSIVTTTLTFTTNSQLSSFAPGTHVTEENAGSSAGEALGLVSTVDSGAKQMVLVSSSGTWDNGNFVKGQSISAASGTVASTDLAAKTMTLSTSNGTWGVNTGKWVIGPEKTVANTKLFTVHDAAGAVSDLQSADPGYVTMTGSSPYTLTFPATLPSGNDPDTDLPDGTTITVDVQATSGGTSVNKVSNTVTPAAGGAGIPMGGGYFAGQIKDPTDGKTYNLIVAPKVSGGLLGQYSTDGGTTAGTLQYKTSNTGDSVVAQNEVYGGTATTTFADASHPAFDWCVNSPTGPNSGAGIGGFKDWYIPSRYEMEIIYRNLKPGTGSNATDDDGINPNAVPPTAVGYTTGDPAQTTVAIFQVGGAQAFDESNYLTSTESSGDVTKFGRDNFYNGDYNDLDANSSKTFTLSRVRAIRRVPA